MAKRLLRGTPSDPLQSASYLSKASKERLKLQADLTQSFSEDMQRCFRERILTNLHFVRVTAVDSTSTSVVVECHTALMRKRLPPLWERCKACSSFQTTEKNLKTVDISELPYSEDQICDLVRSLYSCSSNLLNSKWCNLQETVTNNDCETGVKEVEDAVARVSFTEDSSCNSPLRADVGLMKDVHEMLREQDDHDVNLELDNKTVIPAHRFILACRSTFFEAMLSGRWRESSATTISLPGISHQSLLVILDLLYGSVESLPESCNIIELSQHMDMWEISSLKDVIHFHLKQEYCHFFHKPCNACLNSVPDCLIFSHERNQSALKESCLRWIHKYLARTWNQKSFATLPQDILDLCCQYSTNQLNLHTCITMLTNVDNLSNSLPTVRWADNVRPFCERLRADIMYFTAQNFTHPMVQRNFRTLLEGMGWSESLVKSLLSEVVKQLNSESASTVLILALQLKDAQKYDGLNCDASEVISYFYDQCHKFIACNLSSVQYSSTWSNLPAAIQQKLKKTAVFVDDRGPPSKSKPKLSSSLKNQKKKEKPK